MSAIHCIYRPIFGITRVHVCAAVRTLPATSARHHHMAKALRQLAFNNCACKHAMVPRTYSYVPGQLRE